MKRILYTIAIFLICFKANSQFPNTQGIGSNKTFVKSLGALSADSGLIILNVFPDTTTANFSVVSKYNSFIRVGTNLYFRTLVPLKWNLLVQSSGSGFITPSDTATMLSNYTRDSDTAFLVANRLKVSDTATMLQRGWLANRSKDSTAVLRALINSKGNGSVVSVATNVGSGIAGGTITTTGTLRIDTLNVSTRLWRQKGIDSTVGLIVQKVNIIDTAAMLNPYLRKSDTATMLSNRLKISDTLTMLSPYLRKTDTANLVSPYTRVTRFTDSLTAVQARVQTKLALSGGTMAGSIDMATYNISNVSNLGVGNLSVSGTAGLPTPTTISPSVITTGIAGLLVRNNESLLREISAATMLTHINAISRADSLLGGYTTWALTKKKVDSLGALIGGGGSGTVTSIATNNGSGITGGTITTSGTIAADTSVLSTKANVTALLLGKLNLSAISGTANYLSKYATTTTLGNSQVFDNGTIVAIGGTSGSSLFNVIGQQGITNTTTHSSGTAAALGVTATTTYTGTLTTSNASFSSIVNNHASIFNGNTTVNGNTPFGSSLPSSIISFSNTGTVTMDNVATGIKSVSALVAGSFDNGSVNGTVTRTSGIQINGIAKVSGATATITRTNHYQLLISDINEFGSGGSVTNRYGIYQVGANDSNFFAGNVKLPNLGSTTGTTIVVDGNGNLFKLTSSRKYKENIVDLDTNKVNSIYSLKGKNYNYIKDNVTTAGIIAEEVDSLGLKDLVVYKDGKPDGLNYQAFTPYIIELLKSQKLEIEMLKKEIIALKNKQ